MTGTLVCRAHLKSVTPYSQSRQHDTPKLENENWEDYEKRTWMNKTHTDKDGIIYMPPMAFKMGLDRTVKYDSMQIPGRGKSTYSKHFLSGSLCWEKLSTGINVKDVEHEWINANSDGVRGSGKRVKRCYPLIPSWEGEIDFHVMDLTITKKVYETVLIRSGLVTGVGRFRPENGGYYGRYEILDMTWSKK